jgi:hypothetical protein
LDDNFERRSEGRRWRLDRFEKDGARSVAHGPAECVLHQDLAGCKARASVEDAAACHDRLVVDSARAQVSER